MNANKAQFHDKELSLEYGADCGGGFYRCTPIPGTKKRRGHKYGLVRYPAIIGTFRDRILNEEDGDLITRSQVHSLRVRHLKKHLRKRMAPSRFIDDYPLRFTQRNWKTQRCNQWN
jgi:hypothetical protein